MKAKFPNFRRLNLYGLAWWLWTITIATIVRFVFALVQDSPSPRIPWLDVKLFSLPGDPLPTARWILFLGLALAGFLIGYYIQPKEASEQFADVNLVGWGVSMFCYHILLGLFWLKLPVWVW